MLRRSAKNDSAMKKINISTFQRKLIAIVAIILIIALGLIGVDRVLYPSRSEIEKISPGMTKDEVITLLGGLYDESRLGEYNEIDRMVGERDQGQYAASIISYRISSSRDTVWIMCDGDDRVIETWTEE